MQKILLEKRITLPEPFRRMNREGKLNNMLNPVLDKIVNNSVYIQKPVKIERDKDYVLKLQNQIESGT